MGQREPTDLAPRRPRLELGIAIVLVALYAWYGLRSAGTYYDDEISHYLIARYSWKYPQLLLSTWGRPAFTILYAPVALLGFPAVRLFSAALAAVVCLLSAWVARRYGVRRYWLAAVFTGLQPEFFRLAFSSLTELTFALLLAAALLAWRTRRWGWMAAAVGWMPLARYESLPLVLVFALLAVRAGRPRVLWLMGAPIAMQNAFHAIETQSLAALLFPLDQAIGLGASDWTPDYGTGPISHYFTLLPGAWGWIVLALAVAGSMRMHLNLLHASAVLVTALLVILYRYFPAAGVAGYARHLVMVAPALGVLAARGADACLAPVRRESWATALAAALALAVAGEAMRIVRPFPLSPERRAVAEAAAWWRDGPYSTRLVLGSHPAWVLEAGIDRYDPTIYRRMTRASIETAPAGSVVFWDSHFSHRLRWQTPKAVLEDPSFRLLRSWSGPPFEIHAFEKVAE